MSIKMEQIMPEFEKLRMTEVKGQRLINTVTFNPDRAEPGEEIYVTIPKLKPGVCIVPNSLYLRARFKNKKRLVVRWPTITSGRASTGFMKTYGNPVRREPTWSTVG